MSSTRAMKQTGKMPKMELEALLRETVEAGAAHPSRADRADWDALASAVEPPPSSIVFPLVTRKA